MSMEWVFLHEARPWRENPGRIRHQQDFGVSVVAVGRDGHVITGPDGSFRLEAGDYWASWATRSGTPDFSSPRSRYGK